MLEWSILANPGNADWLGILVDLYRRVGRLDDALLRAREMVRLHPGRAAAHIELARVHADRADPDAAIAAFHAAVAVAPGHAVAHFGLAQMLLLQGDYRAGWVEYEWRHKLDMARPAQPSNRPSWNGMRMPQGHLLLYNDQGFGDAFQFIRYVEWVARRVGRVSLLCDAACVPLFRNIPGLDAVSADAAALAAPAEADMSAQTSLASLPGLAGTTLETIPAVVPYVSAPAARVGAWAQMLSQRLPARVARIGLAWAGNQAPPGDPRRSVPLSALTPLMTIEGAAFVSLQKHRQPGDERVMSAFAGMLDLGPELGDFGETAAIIANLDLVISICSSVTHLAGALACPVWVMLAHTADWRWLSGRDDSPWYPTARLFRQHRPGGWSEVVAALVAALPGHIANGMKAR